MAQGRISFLKTVDIRQAWSKEDRDFTPWMAQPDVLAELFDECDIDIGVDFQVEKEVVLPNLKRRLDILVTTEGGERIAIENQFAAVDHDHLTRGLMYAVSLKARAVIVVAETHRPEFIELADYLNGAAQAYEEEGIALFLVQIELLTSPSSELFHPRFTVVAGPDEWKATVFRVRHRPPMDELGARAVAVFDFHELVLPVIREKSGIFKNVVATDASWKAGSFGVSSVQVKYDVARDSVGVQLWFHRKSASENRAGIEYVRQFEGDLAETLDGRDLSWRIQNTALVETRVSGIGWGMLPTAESIETLACVVANITTFAKSHIDGIRIAVKSVGDEE
jgi:hypothetical protein